MAWINLSLATEFLKRWFRFHYEIFSPTHRKFQSSNGLFDFNSLTYAFLVFHSLIIAGILPRNVVWDGRLTDTTFFPLEVVAIILNLLLITAGGVARNYITQKPAITLINYIKWFLFYFVVFNTFAGLFSTTTLEVLMTPATALYALCLYRIIRFSDGLKKI